MIYKETTGSDNVQADFASRDPSTDPERRTVSSDTLLVNGSDNEFRKTIHNLMAISNIVDALRAGYANLTGITAAQHELLMLIYRTNDGNGITGSYLASMVKVTPSFIATETGKLKAAGLIEKRPDEKDRRLILLVITEYGRQQLVFLSKYQRQVNDVLFSCFDKEEFLAFSLALSRLLTSSERAADIQTMLVRDFERSTKVSFMTPGRDSK